MNPARSVFRGGLAFLALAALLVPRASCPQPSAQSVRVGISPLSPAVILNQGEPRGFSIDLWEALARELGWNYEYVGSPGVSEKLSMLADGKTDLALGGISVTEHRETRFDFTYPTFHTGLDILTTSEVGFSLVGIVRGLATRAKGGLVLGFILLVLVAGHLIWLAERGGKAFNDKYVTGVLEGIYWAVVTASTVGYGDKAPVKWRGRFLAMLVIVVSLPMFALFTAELASNLTLYRLQSKLQGPEDLRGKRVGVVEGATAEQAVKSYGARGVPFATVDDAIEALKNQQVAAVVHDAPSLLYYVQNEGRDWAVVVGRTFRPQTYGIALPEESPLREPLNRALLTLKEDGTLDEIHTRWFGENGR